MPRDIPTIGLVGCGRWGSLILRDLRSLGATVDVMVPSAGATDAILDAGARRVVHALDELAAADGIVVASPTATHADVLDTVLEFGVPVFSEKPLTDDAARARALAIRAPDRLFVMDKWRYHPGVLAMRDRVAAGDIGTPSAIRVRRVQWRSPHTDVDCVWVLLPHDLTIAVEIFGAVPTPVWAAAHRGETEVLGLSGAGALPDGVAMQFEIGIASPVADRRVEVVGETGALVLAGGWSDTIDHIRYGAGEPEVHSIATPGELPLLAELRSFLAHLDGGPPPRSSAATGASVVEAIAELRSMAGLTP